MISLDRLFYCNGVFGMPNFSLTSLLCWFFNIGDLLYFRLRPPQFGPGTRSARHV